MGKKSIIYITAVFAFFTFLHAFAQALIADSARNDQSEVKINGGSYVNNLAKLALTIDMEPGWHIYWRDPGDSGFPPALDWQGSTNIMGVEFLWPVPQRYKQELQPGSYIESYIYKDKVTFPITITAQNPNKPIDLSLHISYAICAQTCIPAEADLKLSLPPGLYSEETLDLINASKNLVPQANGTYGLTIASVNRGISKSSGQEFIQVEAVNNSQNFKEASIFIEGGEHYSFTNPIVTINGKSASFVVPVTFLTTKKDLSGATLRITISDGSKSVEKMQSGDSLGISQETNLTESYDFVTLVWIVMLAFVGGMILNVMPCVLPVVSLKLLGIIKHGGDKKSNIRINLLITVFGIIVSFIALFIITIWLKAGGEVVGWGFNFQEPSFIIALVIVLTLFAANLWGLFEIRLPQVFSDLGGGEYEGWMGHFMTGILATILATPCTAPFLGTAIGFSLTRGTVEIFFVFMAMALGLASPYLLLCLFPSMVEKLPKPGSWIIKVKHFMGILLVVAAIWLIWVLSNQLGKLAAIILLFLCILKITKLWASNHYNFVRKIRTPLLLFVVFLAFMIPRYLQEKNTTPTTQQDQELWEDFEPANIAGLVANGKIVFVDVTADWCLTCKANKFLVLGRQEIIDEFTKAGVVAMRADWTNKDKKITQYLIQHRRVGIPFNIVYGPGAPNGFVLPELLSKQTVFDALNRAK